MPLNEVGVVQAGRAAGILRTRGIRSIVASPLSRARRTAEIVAEAVGVPVEVEPDLREVAFGVHEGQDMGDWFDAWVDGRITPEGAEPFAALQARGVAALNRALERPAPLLVVAHGALFRAIRDAMGLPKHVRTANGVPQFCEPGEHWTLTPYAT